MKQRRRIYYTDSQNALMWERWKKGESLQQIAQLFDREHSSIQHILAETGGIRPAVRLAILVPSLYGLPIKGAGNPVSKRYIEILRDARAEPGASDLAWEG